MKLFFFSTFTRTVPSVSFPVESHSLHHIQRYFQTITFTWLIYEFPFDWCLGEWELLFVFLSISNCFMTKDVVFHLLSSLDNYLDEQLVLGTLDLNVKQKEVNASWQNGISQDSQYSLKCCSQRNHWRNHMHIFHLITVSSPAARYPFASTSILL